MWVGGGYMVDAPQAGDVVKMRKYDAVPIVGYGRPGG
jgi:hypothetical protein